jgi:putative transposase
LPRSKRIVVPGLPHHIIQRGNHRINVFLDDRDREVFLRLLGEVSDQHGLLNLGYNLMTNHEHLVSIPKHEFSLSLAMRDLLGPYAVYFNRKYGLNGRLWQGRFYSVPLDEPHFWTALRYVERNPVRAEIVHRAEQYRWSSAPAHCGLCDDPLLAPLPAGAALIGDWSAWLRSPDSASELMDIRKSTRTGRPCGPDSFVKELERVTGRILMHRKTGRPRKRTDYLTSESAKLA